MARGFTSAQTKTAWLFTLPALVVLLLVGLFPFLQTIRYSFMDVYTDGRGDPVYIGIENYTRLVADKDFLESIANTLVFTVVSVSLEFIIGLGLALIANIPSRNQGLLRTAMLLPWALPTVVGAKMWAWMFNDQFGVINDLMVDKLGLLPSAVAWTGQDGYAMVAIITVDVWKTTPFVALLLLAGLQLIPQGLYEAARVDGASRFQCFMAITLPQLRPVILVALIFRTLDAMRVFDVIWVMTNGKFGTESIATFNYRQYVNYFQLGYGSATSVLLFLMIAVIIAAYILILRHEDDVA